MSAITKLVTGHYRVPLPVALSDSTHGVMTAFEVVTVRVADADGIDALAYFFVAREGEQAAVEQALRERMETLPHYQRPRWLHTVEAIPRTATGKMLRRKLAELMGPVA